MTGILSNQAETPHDFSRLLANDAAAWRSVVEDFGPVLQAVARRTFQAYSFAAAPADIDDAVAETWKQLLAHDGRVIRRCRDHGIFGRTLCAMARNRSIDIMRRHRPDVVFQTVHEQWIEPPEAPPAEALDSTGLQAAVRRLPQRERILVRLFFLQRLKYREIAELTGIPQNSIGPTLARALRRLRQRLTEQMRVEQHEKKAGL